MSKTKPPSCDIRIPSLTLVKDRVILRLILNTDGANESKSPPLSAWPVFLAFADLPPIKRQLFQNIVLVSLFVGAGYPDFTLILEHIKKQLHPTESFVFNGTSITVTFQPILFVADLVAKSKVLQMKQFNGYYGCTLCTQRGEHYSGSHHYPPHEKFVMRTPESHLLNISELESGSVEELRAKVGRKGDSEKRTQGVKGRSAILSIIPNQPLSSPIDPMHQLFLGVGKDLITFFYDQMRAEHKSQLNETLSRISLPKELKNTVRPLDSISSFKAKEVKTVLLYLSPLLLAPYFFGEDKLSNKNDLCKLVFAVRELYESSKNTEIADKLLSEFCVSMNEKTEKMDSINFHLLRHLGWQVKNIGPLFVTSAAMFESANRLLIAPLTGTVNHCQLIVQRFIRAKLIQKMEIENDCLSAMMVKFGAPKEFDDSYSIAETTEIKDFRVKYPDYRVFCRDRGEFFLSSVAYGRGSSADRFVAIMQERILVGEILFFFEAPEKMVLLRQFRILKKIRLSNELPNSMPYGFSVASTDEILEIPLCSVSHKFLCLNLKDETYFITLLKHFEHN